MRESEQLTECHLGWRAMRDRSSVARDAALARSRYSSPSSRAFSTASMALWTPSFR